MGNTGAVLKDRYIGGKTFAKYFKEDIWPNYRPLLEGLGLNDARAFKLFRVFALIDLNENAQVDSLECFRFFQPSRNKFTERLFFCEKPDVGNSIRRGFTFKEFIVVIWTFCTLTLEGLARHIFEIFDVDNNFILSRYHVEAMFRMLYDTPTIESEYVDLYSYETDHTIAKATFVNTSALKPVLIRPAIDFQRLLRKKTLGSTVWVLLTQFRVTQFRVFDNDCDRLFEAHEAIVRAVENAALEKVAPTPEQLLAQSESRIRLDTDLAQRELASRQKQQLLDRRRSAYSAPDLQMKRAWATLDAQRLAFEAVEFTTAMDDVRARRHQRDELFELHDIAVELSQEYFDYKDTKDFSLAEGTDNDHEARFEDFVQQSNEGKSMTQLCELYEVFKILQEEVDEKNAKNKNYSEDRKTEKQVLVENNVIALQKLADPIFLYDPTAVTLEELDKRLLILTRRDLTEEQQLARKLAKGKQLQLGKTRAHTILVQFLKAKTLRKTREDLDKARELRRREWIKKEWELVSKYGSRITQWEFVLDKDSNKPCFISSQTGQRRHPKTAFCEKCDAVMVQNELRCVQCDAPRSAKNLLLYRPLGFKDITLE